MPVAIDVGFGWTKAVSTSGTFLEPSVIGPSVPLLEGLGGTQGVRIWDADGQEYFVGRLAVKQSPVQWHSLADNKPGDPNTMRLIRAALACVAPAPNGSWSIDYLITGLPVQLWAKQAKEFEQLLSGLRNSPIRVRHNDSNIFVTTTVEAVKILPQPYGSLLNLVLDDAGSLVRSDVTRGKTLVIDVGFHTVDLLAVDGLEPITRLSTGTNFGLATAWAQIGKQLNKPLWDVDQLILTGHIRDVEPTLRALALNIMGSIESLNERFDTYLVTGGGGQRLYEYLRLPGRVELASGPQMANVKGYLKAGARLLRR